MNINIPSQRWINPLLDQKNPASLFHACQNNNLKTVKKWADTKLNLNPQNSLGETPLSMACKNGYTEIVKTLIEANADLCFQLRSDANHSPLYEAVRNGQTEVFKLLVNEAEKQNLQGVLNAYEKDTQATILHTACVSGNLEIVKILLNYPVYIDVRNDEGGTPLHLASLLSDLKIAKALLKKGACPNYQVKDYYRGLHGYYSTGRTGWTPLHFACKKGNLELAELLISYKGDLYLHNERGKTPLDLAPPDMIPLLLEKLRQSEAAFN